jgi:LPXTG-motif cell wall-anchored protein
LPFTGSATGALLLFGLSLLTGGALLANRRRKAVDVG